MAGVPFKEKREYAAELVRRKYNVRNTVVLGVVSHKKSHNKETKQQGLRWKYVDVTFLTKTDYHTPEGTMRYALYQGIVYGNPTWGEHVQVKEIKTYHRSVYTKGDVEKEALEYLKTFDHYPKEYNRNNKPRK